MTDEHHDDDDDNGNKLFNAREDALEAAMPVLAEFFHIVRCPNHSKEEREQAYEDACVAWDGLEECYVREITLTDRLAALDGMNADHGASTLEIHDTETGKTMHVHPGSRAIN